MPDSLIKQLSFSEDCRITVQLEPEETIVLQLPNDRSLSNTFCPINPKYAFSTNKKIAAFDNYTNLQNHAVSIYLLTINKTLTIDNVGAENIVDFMFLPDNHLLVLLPRSLRVYDLNSLINTYPQNVDFYQNRFKDVSLQVSAISPPTNAFLASIYFESGKVFLQDSNRKSVAQYDLHQLYPKSSCPCWDNTNNICLPQSSCLTP